MSPLATAQPQPQYSITDRWKIGGEGRCDSILADGAAHRLYLAHNTRVEIVDTATGKLAGAITGLKNAHGIALDRDGRTGFITDGGSNTVVVFDRLSLKIITTFPAGTDPDTITFDSATRTVWAFNSKSHDVTVIDAATRKVTSTLPLPGEPESATSDNKGTVYVNIRDKTNDKNEIVRIDTAVGRILVAWPLPGCDAPTGMAIDRLGHRLFSVCRNGKMAVTDATSGEPLGSASIGPAPDAAGYDPAHKVAFSSNSDGTLTIIEAGGPTFPTLQTLRTEIGARTLSVDLSSGRAYLATAQLGPAPAATASTPHPQPPILPGTLTVLVVSR